MKKKFLILIALLSSILCPLHAMEQNTDNLSQALQKKHPESSHQCDNYSIKLLTGNAVKEILPFVSTQVITAFREYPYLYEGKYEEEMDFRTSLAQHHNTAVAVAYHKETPVGFLTGYTFVNFDPHFKGSMELFKQANLKPEEYYYLGEVIIVPEHRGGPLCGNLFDTMENYVQNLGYQSTCMVTEEHESHPLKPKNYRSLVALWEYLGYQKTSLVIYLNWLTHQPDGSVEDAKHPLTYWIKQLAQQNK